MTVKRGKLVADNITHTDDEQVQPSGVDLRVDKVFELLGKMKLTKDGKELPNRKEVEFSDNTSKVVLSEGVYVVRYKEKISIPEDAVGLVQPRSSLMRGGNMLNTALWDPGYEGVGEGRLKVDNTMILEHGARIGQIFYMDADRVEEGYDGTYQGENVKDEEG